MAWGHIISCTVQVLSPKPGKAHCSLLSWVQDLKGVIPTDLYCQCQLRPLHYTRVNICHGIWHHFQAEHTRRWPGRVGDLLGNYFPCPYLDKRGQQKGQAGLKVWTSHHPFLDPEEPRSCQVAECQEQRNSTHRAAHQGTASPLC